MARNRSGLRKRVLSALMGLGAIVIPLQARAQAAEVGTDSQIARVNPADIEMLVKFEAPEGEGDPEEDGTAGGATRSQHHCISPSPSYRELTLLLPIAQSGLTTAQHPTFFVYVPPTTASQAEFVLRDGYGDGIYQTTVSLGNAPGILRIDLPESLPALEFGHRYQWSFAMICQPSDRLQDWVVDGWIERTELDPQLASQLEGATPLERAAAYGNAGIWYDTLSTLASLRAAQPHSDGLANTWENLLKSEAVQLGQIAREPLLSCCTSNP
ncbi:DUF928 domain-containing protein [Oxynema sp. CENA135]|uniref:DUF928 domain-containing protein n=1 Tax=Oxynema sp. CENA135 TaxID=984206 RepID=UPI00190BFB98|nr:DUF928 domain-containing protein [Oxynema sp. CENA135]MBK4729446.1 DUF928 domain-containing protein [Oxynema sp. CENA135]